MTRILASAALLLALAAPAAATETLYVQAASELRQSASEVSRSLRPLPAGASVESYGRRGDWVNVRVPASQDQPGLQGWLHHTAVGPRPPTGGQEPAR